MTLVISEEENICKHVQKNNVNETKILMENKKFDYTFDKYIYMFAHINVSLCNKDMISLILNYTPSHSFTLSKLLSTNIYAFSILTHDKFNDFVLELLQVSNGRVIVDDFFLYLQFGTKNLSIIKRLIVFKNDSQKIIDKVLDEAIVRKDYPLIDFLVSELRVFDNNFNKK